MRAAVQIPEFLKIAAPDSGVSAKDIGRILNLSANRINTLCRLGEIPKPDFQHRYGQSPMNAKNFWRASTVRNWLKGRAV